MRLWIELSGEHPTLPRAEALAAFEAEGCVVREAAWSRQVLHLDVTGPSHRAAERLGLAYVVCEELARGSWDDVRAFARSYELGGQRFRTKVRGLGVDVDAKAVERALGAEFGRTGRVDLGSPSVDFRLLVADAWILGRVMHRVDRHGLEARKAEHRPFNLPISLHPKLARALVNLSRVPTGGVLVDPFCGTGGVLLEAAGLGLVPVGADVQRSMIAGARRSLRALNAHAHLLVADAGRVPWKRGTVRGVATDPPYGRAATTKGEPALRLYERSFAGLADVLAAGGHVAAVLPSEAAIEAVESSLTLLERHAVRVHRSLTRNFCAFRL